MIPSRVYEQDALIRCVLALTGEDGARELQRVRLLTSQVGD